MTIVCLAKVSPLNPATGTRVDLYLSSANDSRVTGLNGQVWEPAMTAAPTLSINLWQGDFQEPVDTGGASFGFNIGILKMTYANADSYMWAGAPVEIYAEEPGTAWPWAARFKGRIAGFSRRNEVVTINAKIDTEPFEKNVLTATYAGTTGAEGGADLKGRLKPLVFGWAKNVEPVLIDTVNSVYQFSAYGAIEAVSVLYERANDFGASVGDHATYAALVAASIPAGRWATCLAAGMVRLGAPAAGVITGDIRGHNVGGATPRLTGAIISALATIAGVSAGNIETSTLTALDTAVAYPINIVLTEQSKFIDIAAALALGCNWQSGITLQGKFFVLAVTLTGSEVLTLNAQGSALPQVTASDEQDVSVPYYQTILGANRNWRVQSADEIAFNAPLIPRGMYSASETYREGNIVTTDDGATWLYINTTASSGNPPPTLPTTSNAYWSSMTEASPVAVLGFLTNESHNVYADSAGTVASWTGAGGTFVVQENGVTLSSGITFSLVSATGVTVSIDASTGVYAATAMSANTGTATLRAVYNGVTIEKIFSVSKSVQGSAGAPGAPGDPGAPGAPGAPATSAYLTNESVQLYAYANGNVVSYSGATGVFKVFAGSTDVSSNFALSTVANPQSITIGYSGRTYTVTGGFDVSEDTATVTIRATGSGAYSGVAFDKVLSLSKAKGGYEIVATLPTTGLFVGRVIFNDTDDRLYRYTDNGWTSVTQQPDSDNLVPNGSFSTGNFDGWSRFYATGGLVEVRTDPSWAVSKYGLLLYRVTTGVEISVVASPKSWDDTPTQGIFMAPGDELYFECDAWTSNTSTSGLADVLIKDAFGTLAQLQPSAIQNTYISGGTYLAWNPGATFVKIKGSFTNNTGQPGMAFLRILNGWGNATATEVYAWNVVLRKRTAAVHLTANSVTADKIQAGAITAAKVGTNEIIAFTGNIKDLTVSTLKIANNAVTVPSSAFTGTQILCPPSTLTTVQQVTVATTGAPVFIFFNGLFNNSGAYADVGLYLDGSLILDTVCTSALQTFTACFTHMPSAGTHTYAVKVTPNSGVTDRGVSNRSLFILETKR